MIRWNVTYSAYQVVCEAFFVANEVKYFIKEEHKRNDLSSVLFVYRLL